LVQPNRKPICTNQAQTQQAAKRIAIVLPAMHPSMDAIETGFKKTMQENRHDCYAINTYNANGDKRLLHSHIEQIASSNYDLVFTVGACASMLCKEVFEKRGTQCPIVFGAVDDPVALNLVTSLQKPGKNITGVIEDPAYETQLKLLKAIKPNVKNIMLLYNPTQGSGLEKHYNTINMLAKKLDLTVTPELVYATNEIYTKLTARITSVDTVLVLKDHTIVSGIDGVIKLCNQHQVTLFTTELDSGDKGAALSFGVYEQDFGIQGAVLARKILDEHIKPEMLSCITLNAHKLKLNTKIMMLQGLSLSPDFIMFLQHIVVI
jgi:putative ABC transport system substrate-binding protein